MKKANWIILAVIVIAAAIVIGVLNNAKNNAQNEVNDLTAKVAELEVQLAEAKGAAEAAAAEVAAAEAAAEEARLAAEELERQRIPLVVGYPNLSQKFSPFFFETAYDHDMVELTQIGVLTKDRMGGVVNNAIEGETRTLGGVEYTYKGPADVSVVQDKANNTTAYTMKIREDLVFSDGTPVTADDIIFTYYVYLDTSYVGASTLNSVPIVGLANYRTQTTDEVFTKYNDMFDAIRAAGEDHVWAEGDAWTKEQQDWLWKAMQNEWVSDVQAITDYVVATYAEAESEKRLGIPAADLESNEGAKVALGMVIWGFAEKGDAGLTGGTTGTVWTLTGTDFPTIEDYYKEAKAKYTGDPATYWTTENNGDIDGTDVLETTRGNFVSEWGPKDPSIGEGGVPNIAGIKKLDDYTVEVTTVGFEAPAVYQILDVYITPMHYYGDPAQYDYENNQFGFPRGDISIVEAKTAQPMGAGPFKFIKYDNKVVYYEANESYFKGAPATKYLQIKESLTDEFAPGVKTGTIDMGELSGSKSNFELVASYNSNKELTGDVITTNRVDNRGYGYIGINAETVKVGEDPFSDASKNLRKAIATVIAVYRDVAYNSYYGDAAAVINYPISNTSWAAPQPTDEDYKVAFSVDAEGKDIYTSDMNQEDKYAAALEAAKGYLKAAGYTLDDAGVVTAAPEGGTLAYELIIPADGKGNHPSFAVVTDASNALKTIGITLNINDPSNSNVLWDALDAGTQELWCAAWQTTEDPDMYQIYHSSNIVGKGGTDSNHYHIALPELDQLIMDARQSDDQAYRKAVYKQALDLLVDQAVEIPAYQRQNSTIFSTQRIDIPTVTPGMTTYWGWIHDLESIKMLLVK